MFLWKSETYLPLILLTRFPRSVQLARAESNMFMDKPCTKKCRKSGELCLPAPWRLCTLLLRLEQNRLAKFLLRISEYRGAIKEAVIYHFADFVRKGVPPPPSLRTVPRKCVLKRAKNCLFFWLKKTPFFC